MDVPVVIPARNRRTLLATTVRGAFRQQRVDFELIVVGEASGEDTNTGLDAVADPTPYHSP